MVTSAEYLSDPNYIVTAIDGVSHTVSLSRISARDGEIARRIAQWLDLGNAIAPYVAPLVTEADYAVAIQSHVDTIAKSKGYADGVALAGYSTSTIPAWAAEAAAFISWRDQVWMYAYTELAKFQGGQREVPTITGLITGLPAITWPGGIK